MHPDVQALIERFALRPLPFEGTLFSETWRSATADAGAAPLGTAMIGLYCDDPPSHSRFHRLEMDEVWHFYAGDPLRLILLRPDGTSEDVVLGADWKKGQHLQYVIPAGTWQAGHLVPGGQYALYGCTLAPGFTLKRFESGNRDVLLRQYPDRADDITRLT
jgi:predicted cupin superfamily sugar epimerase